MGIQADQVRDDIVKRVQARSLLPGDKIDEVDLRRRLDLSGTPIREAVIALEATGILKRRPRGGARVAALDLEGLIKLVEAHSETEGTVAYCASRRINSEQAKALEKAVVDCENFDDNSPKTRGRYYDLNLAFHVALLAAAGNEFLDEILYRNGNRLIGYFSARHLLPGEPARSAADHRLIYQAVIDGDGDRARRLMIDHVIMSNAQAIDVMNHLSANIARQTITADGAIPADPIFPDKNVGTATGL